MALNKTNKISKKLSIQNKLIIINMSVVIITLFFASTIAVVGEYRNQHDFFLKSIQIQAKIIANNTTATLVFKDKTGAEKILEAFTVSPDIHSATIYDDFGKVFASYIKQEKTNPNNKYDNIIKSIQGSSNIFNNQFHINESIILEDEPIGTLYIQVDTSRIYADIFNYLVYTVIIALTCLIFASLLLFKLSKNITRPLLRLTELMSTVIKNDDYTIRIENHSEDEIGVLSEGFNKMLAYIQVNDERLEHELSERNKTEEHLDKLAYFDVTTNLPNRHFFHKQLDQAVKRAISSNQKMVLLFLDLDNFKTVNDTAGHKTGDLLLKQASSRLTGVLRQNDYICRIGGDEFAIIIENVNDISDISTVTKKCIEILSNPFELDGNIFFIGASIGISICPDDTSTSNDLLINADMAMYEAKTNGKNNYQYYNHGMNLKHSHKFQIESDLRHAISMNQLELYYQPQIDSNSDQIIGFEALMRWTHHENGIISPDVFIPIAEKTGLILPLGKWLIETACIDANQFIDSGITDFTVSINISGIQIRDKSFIKNITDSLSSTGLDPRHLEIELTESTLMDDSDLVIKKVNALKKLGIKIAIDDFGTGFSSMSYLKSFPVSKLKIDKGFITGLPNSNEDTAIVRAIIAMSHGLNINVIAEGVERQDQVDLLKELSCDMFQGYYYAKPVPIKDLIK
ncbi:MAG: EAL domain-containing protein [Gammaproteobacteria bacterium]|nr:EAL domain-containing protein [Gammaproteobacteria bacterium]